MRFSAELPTAEFGSQLRTYRRRSRLTQAALSDLSTVSVRAVGNLERGQVDTPRRDTVRLLADALRLTAHERGSFESAAGLSAGDALFDTMAVPTDVVSRPLHGRDEELDVLARQLLDGYKRVAVVTGLGGVGKTRLAGAVAQRIASGTLMRVLWVPPCADGSVPGRPETADLTEGGAAVETLVQLIGTRPVLLVVDGNDDDHVSPATLDVLLRQCPRLRILETTRGARTAAGGLELALPPLAAAPALELLLELITGQQPGFRPEEETIAALIEVCARLDGLPRALEAAAAWSSVLDVGALAAMAREEPHVLAAAPEGGPDVRAATVDAVLAQPAPNQDLLHVVSGWSEPWTVEQVAACLGTPRPETARGVRELLGAGLITRVISAGGHLVGFTVLNTVAACLRGPYASTGVAADSHSRFRNCTPERTPALRVSNATIPVQSCARMADTMPSTDSVPSSSARCESCSPLLLLNDSAEIEPANRSNAGSASDWFTLAWPTSRMNRTSGMCSSTTG